MVYNVITNLKYNDAQHWRTGGRGWGARGTVAPGGTFEGRHLEFLGVFVRNMLLQIRFKCLDFAQKCCQNAGNAISETQISKFFEGGNAPGPPSWTRRKARTCTPPGAADSSFAPGGKSASYASNTQLIPKSLFNSKLV